MENRERPSTGPATLAALVIAVFVFGACGGSAPPDTAPASKKAPAFTVETFDGEAFSLAEHRGTPVVLNFWESW